MSSREDILGRVRARLKRDDGNARTAAADIETWLAARTQGPRPAVGGDLPARFRALSEALSSSVEAVESWQVAPAAIARYFADRQLTPAAVCWPQLQRLPWREAGIEVEARAAIDADLVGITGAFCAIAETGTLMLLSGPDTPGATSLLPETHVALVAASRIVAGMEDAWNLVRAETAELPRAVSFISGPSRTGDIEQTIVLGAHGPYRVHIVIVMGS